MDLTLILQAVFQVSQEERLERDAMRERLNEIIYEFHTSDKKRSIHTTIWAFVGSQRPSAKAVVGKIESLIIGNEVRYRNLGELIAHDMARCCSIDDIQGCEIRPEKTCPSIITYNP